MRFANIIVLCALFFVKISGNEDISSLVDLEALSVLPLEALLNIKKNVNVLSTNNTDTADQAATKENSAEALPFHGLDDIRKKEGYYGPHQNPEEYSQKYDKKKGITNFFQMSVTSLAFLAFGGYLLFLIITAIKGQNHNYFYDPNTAQIMSALLNAQLNHKKKQKKRPINNNNYYYSGKEGESVIQTTTGKVKREVNNNNQIINNIDEMYGALLNLCEGYSKIADYYQP